MRIWFVLGLTSVACSTVKNPDLCCTDAVDCASKDIPATQMCSEGLVCRGSQCIAESCSTSVQCEAGAPYCTGAGLCAATCDMDAECPGFDGDASHPFCDMGSCVQCRTNDDCAASSPVCDAGACRGCELDTECASGACGDNHMCIAEASIVYVDPAGADAGTCTKDAACKTLQYAVSNTLANRSHIVLSTGTYLTTTTVEISSMKTVAPTVIFHGHGATVQYGDNTEYSLFVVGDVATTFQDLTIAAGMGSFGNFIFTQSAPTTVRRLRVDGRGTLDGIYVGANMTIEDADISNARKGLILTETSHLLLDRVAIHGGQTGIQGGYGGVVDITNLVAYDLTEQSVDLTKSTGTVRFSTISRTAAAASGTTTAGVLTCTSGLTVQNTIIWMPGVTPVAGDCALSNSLAGPDPSAITVSTVSVSRADPLFLDEDHRDFHLTAQSPAVDQLDSGPVTDYEGVSRPQGPKYDYGAFEYKP